MSSVVSGLRTTHLSRPVIALKEVHRGIEQIGIKGTCGPGSIECTAENRAANFNARDISLPLRTGQSACLFSAGLAHHLTFGEGLQIYLTLAYYHLY